MRRHFVRPPVPSVRVSFASPLGAKALGSAVGLLISLAFLGACGSTTEEPGPAAAADASDLGTLFDIAGDLSGQDSPAADTALLDLAEGVGGDVAADASGAGETVGSDSSADGAGGDAACGEPGCACSQNSTCNTGLCLEIGASKQCATLCVSGCPQGLKCSQISGSGGDIIGVCTEINPRLCEPCSQDSDCNSALGGADNRCVKYSDNSGSQLGYFCSTPCSDTAPCATGYACQEKLSAGGVKSKQCVRQDLVCPCDERAVQLGLSTVCNNATAAGTCAGTRTCSAAGLSACNAAAASAEQCNLKDDDCDGQTDEPSAGMCDDNNACSYDNCMGGAECQHPPKIGACDDGSACTSGDSCSDGKCVGKDLSCDDKNPCTKDSCDPTKGCVSAPDDQAECSDGSACSVGDTCSGGVCLGGAATLCDDGNPCTTDSCNPKSGCGFANNTAACSDGDLCSLGDTCSGGKCQGGGKLPCSDGNPCTSDGCDALKGCQFSPNSGSCSDNSVCTEGDTCGDGSCQPGKAKSCDDSNPCTTDACNAASGCYASPNSLPCDDGSVCNIGDVCASGACTPGKPISCDDGNPCTDDSCDKAKGCVHSANSSPCSDENACSTKDFCAGGKCVPGALLNCDDGNACSDDACDPASGCTHESNTAPCSDGSICTLSDACFLGKCVPGTPLVCNDGNPCTDDSCDKASGCKQAPNAASCDDGNACTSKDICSGGSCTSGGQISCDDGNSCTDDGCKASGGCFHSNNSASCTDGSVCSGGDTCSGGACKAGPSIGCDDGNVCTDNSCDAVKGCQFANNTASCNDGSGCTGGDICSGGKCAGATSCSSDAVCTPGAQSVSCKCKAGYSGDGFTCADIDECKTNNGGCGSNGTCTNTAGSFTCGCSSGYGNCDASLANGCEVTLASNTSHCGQCGNACGAGKACINSQCVSQGGCADGSEDQVFTSGTMVGCNGSYTKGDFETACGAGWHPANPNEYFSYGGKTVSPTAERWVDTAWDASGKDISLKNWSGYYDCSNGAGWNGVCNNSDCTWLSTTEQCHLNFVDTDYGQSYGCHCRGGNPNSTGHGVICVNDSKALPRNGCIDPGGDKLIMVADLNACLKAKGAAFYNVQWIEVAYGNTSYLDNVCKAMGYSSYSTTHGGDQCSNSANMYPSHCGQGWLGAACSNGCGNANYDGFYCN